MIRRVFAHLSAMILIASSPCIAADEFVVVTGQHGYFLTDKMKVVDAVEMGAVLRVSAEVDDYFVVEHLGEELRLHKRLCSRSSDWKYVTSDNYERIIKSLQQLQKGLREENLGNHERALAIVRQAAATIENKSEQQLPLHAWIRHFESYVHYSNEEYEKADAVIAECDAELRRIDARFSSFGGDLENVSALVKAAQEEWAEATKLHKQALRNAKVDRPRNHVDIAIISENLSQAYTESEEFDGAIASQTDALEIYKSVYPVSAEEVILATIRLAETYRDAERYEVATKFYQTGLRNLIVYHPYLIGEIADARANLIDAHYALGNYDAAEKVCRELIRSLRKFELSDAIVYRKHTYQRMSLIDYDQEDFAAALRHCEDAIDLADSENFDVDDGVTFEFAGNAYVGLNRPREAKASYDQAVAIYIETEGPDSENLVTVRESLEALDSDTSNSLESIVVVAEPQGYLLDDDGNVISTIPGLTVLKWASQRDEFHEVEFSGKIGRISNAQIHVGRQIPGFGSVSADSLMAVMKHAADAVKALTNRQLADCQQALANGKQICDGEDVSGTTLDYWHRLLVLTSLAQLNGIQGIAEKLDALGPELTSLDDDDGYSIRIDFESARALILAQAGQPDAVTNQRQSLKLAESLFGRNHSVTNRARSRLAKSMFAVGDRNGAIQEFAQVAKISRQIFPPQTSEIEADVVALCVAIINTSDGEPPTGILEELLKDHEKFAFKAHSLATTALGKAYAEDGNNKAARTLLTAVINAVRDDKDVPALASTQAYTQLGQLELSDEKWNAAIGALKEALALHDANESGASFAASEVHRLLADAYTGSGDTKSAESQLQAVLKIYDALGGSDSPQADGIRKRLQEMGATPEPDEPTPLPVIAQYFNFAPPGEEMLIVRRACSVFADVKSASDKVITDLKAKDTVWSLEERDGRHRIYLPEQQSFGWVKATDVLPQEETLIEKTFAELDKTAGASDRIRNEVQAIKSAFELVEATSAEASESNIESLEKAVRLLKKHKQRDSLPYIVITAELASMYAQEGQAQKAAKVIDDQLSPLLSVVGYYHPFVAANRRKQATHARQLGDTGSERSELDAIVKICTKRFGPDDPRTQFQQLNHAGSLIRRGFFEDGRKIFERQIDLEKNGPATLTRAAAHLGLAGLEASDGDEAGAAQHAEESLNILQELQFPIPDLTAQSVILLARSIGRGGEFEEALGLMRRLGTLAPGASADARLLSLIQRSKIAAYANRPDASTGFAISADKLAVEEFGEQHFRRHDALQARGRAVHFDNPKAAATAYDEARQLSLAYINEVVSFQSADSQISFMNGDERWLEEALSVAADGEAGVTESATWMLNFHNLLPRLLARDRRARALIKTRPEYNALTLWRSERSKRAAIPLTSRKESDELQLKQVAADIASEERSYFRDLPKSAQEVVNESLPWISPADVQQKLEDDEALIMIREVRPAYSLDDNPFESEPRPPAKFSRRSYMAWIVPGNPEEEIQAFELAVYSDSIAPLVNAVTQSAIVIDDLGQLSDSGSVRKQGKSVAKDTRILRDAVWTPLADKLPASARRLVLCLDGDLQRVPWEALPTKSNRTVLDEFTLRYVACPRDLLATRGSAKSGSPVMLTESPGSIKDELLSRLGRDQLEHLDRQTRGGSHPFTPQIRDNVLGAAVYIPAGLDDDVELAAPFGSLYSADAQVFTHSDASEIRYFMLQNPQALHISALGMVASPSPVRDLPFALSQSRRLIANPSSKEANPLLRCGLALAGFSLSDTRNHVIDGVLTGEEIVTNDLRSTELVALPLEARVVVNKDNPGKEVDDAGALLPQAFLLAGAHSVLAPHWRVDKKTALQVMKTFYRSLKEGKSKSAALRAAQLEVRETLKKQDGVAHPLSWTAFRLMGDG